MSQRLGERWVAWLTSADWKSERRLGRKPGPVWFSVWARENRRQACKRLKRSLDVMCPGRWNLSDSMPPARPLPWAKKGISEPNAAPRLSLFCPCYWKGSKNHHAPQPCSPKPPASLLQLKSTCKPDALAQPRPQAQAGKHSNSKSMATGKMFKRRYL